MGRRLAIAVATACAVAAIAVLASAGSRTTRADPATTSIEACARTPGLNVFARLPAGMHAAPLDDLIVGMIEDQISVPPEMQKWLQMRQINRGTTRIGVMAVVPAGNQRASLLNAFVSRAMRAGSSTPRQVGGATLVHLSTAYGNISAAMTLRGCRAVLVASRNDATTMLVIAHA
jgi:hypothetical protein